MILSPAAGRSRAGRQKETENRTCPSTAAAKQWSAADGCRFLGDHRGGHLSPASRHPENGLWNEERRNLEIPSRFQQAAKCGS